MNRPPRVSIIMPVYNGADYLSAALDSVLAQEFTDFECLCLNDGSTDTTAEILGAYAQRDRRISHIENPYNLGLPATLNRGFERARGYYHSWTSHDNLLRPDMLAVLVRELDAHPEASVVYAGYSVIDGAGATLRYQPPRDPATRWFGNPVGAAFLYRSHVTEALKGYDESLFGAEDYDFWLRAARQFILRPVQQDLYQYRRHDASLTDKKSLQIKDLVAQVVLRELDQVNDRTMRARAILNLVLTDNARTRLGLFGRAFAQSPYVTAKHIPAVAMHILRIQLRRHFR